VTGHVEPEDVLACMPDWDCRVSSISVLVGGLANRSYVVQAGDRRCVIKLLTEEMDDFGLMIKIPDLIHNTVAAAQSGVAAGVLAAFPDLSAVVLEFIDGRTLEVADLSAPDYIPRLGRAIRALHEGSAAFANHISIFTFLDCYLDLVARHGLRTSRGLMEEVGTLRRIQEALSLRALNPTPCHNDLLAKNIMDDGRPRLIDYDFSGMNDPSFDLGDLSMEGDYDPDELETLCEAYFGMREPVQVARAHLFGVAAQFTWSLLFAAMDQLLADKPDSTFDYFNEADDRWAWTRQQLADPLLGHYIATASGKT